MHGAIGLWWAGRCAERYALVSAEPGSRRHHLTVLAHRAWTVSGAEALVVVPTGADGVIVADAALAFRRQWEASRSILPGHCGTRGCLRRRCPLGPDPWQRRIGPRGPPSGTMSAMNVVVCVKQIPDPAAPGALDPQSHTLVREGKLILDDSDAYGVEMGLQLAGDAGEVTLVSMAPNQEVSGVRTALAMGAAKAIVVSDPALKGSDALSTAKVLAKAIERVGADLILAATESTDGYTGTTPVQVAELLGLPSVTFAKKVTVSDGKVRVERQTEAGFDEVECPMPCLVTVTAGVVEPRYPSFKGIMAAKSKPVDQLTVADLGLDASSVGAAGARQEITSVAAAEARGGGDIVVDEGDAHERIVQFLEQLKLV